MTSATVDAEIGATVLFKCENFQRMGAFKFRGAFNALSRLSGPQRSRGVVAFSSGNHAQAIALAARMHGANATIVMPQDAPASKVAATRGYGGRVLIYDRYRENREEIAARLASEQGLTLIPPYDHPDVIAGAGTATKELIEEAGPLDSLFVCLGGGGLLSGAALAAKALNADGAQTQQLGYYTFAIIRRDVADILTATDEELIACMRFFASRMKIVVEPTGCLGFAAVRALNKRLAGQRVGVIVSGGNIDVERYASLLAERAM